MDDASPLQPGDQGFVVCVKGAAGGLLERSTHILHRKGALPIEAHDIEEIRQASSRMASQALRVLGVAYRKLDRLPEKPTAEDIERDLIFIGLIGMIDPARPEVKPAIEEARQAGIRTVMITGDHPDTARAIASQIGLLRANAEVHAGVELDTMSDEELNQIVAKTDVFARVSPAHKVRIVEAFRARDEVVAMTGDGVNDAPALKRADIGVAMGITGTDVSKETADMVLTDDNYVSIVSAVEQGRIIYSNIRKFVFYLLSCNVAEIAIIFIAALAGWTTPLTPIQLLWLNLLTDGAPALALATEKGDPDIMRQRPRPKSEPIINRLMIIAHRRDDRGADRRGLDRLSDRPAHFDPVGRDDGVCDAGAGRTPDCLYLPIGTVSALSVGRVRQSLDASGGGIIRGVDSGRVVHSVLQSAVQHRAADAGTMGHHRAVDHHPLGGGGDQQVLCAEKRKACVRRCVRVALGPV